MSSAAVIFWTLHLKAGKTTKNKGVYYILELADFSHAIFKRFWKYVECLIRQDIQNNPATPWHAGEILDGEGEDGRLRQEVVVGEMDRHH